MSKILFPLLVIVGLLVSPHVYAQPFTWGTMVTAMMKLNKSFNYKANVDAYMQMFRKDVWNRYHNDEFALDDKRKETLKIMQDQVAAFPIQEAIEIHSAQDFGKYNFEKGEFQFQPLSADQYFYVDNPRFAGIVLPPPNLRPFVSMPTIDNSFPLKIKLFFSNPEKISGIKMEKGFAKNFIGRRTSNYGDINRRV